MQCERWSALDADYLAGRLAPSEVEAFRRHIEECDRCGERLLREVEIRAAFDPEYPTAEHEQMSGDPGSVTCDDVAQRDLVDRYVEGRLDNAHAEAFERHYFACEACWGAVQGAVGVIGDASSTAGPRRAGAPPGLAASRPRRWMLLAAAAVVVIASAGVFAWFSRPAPESAATMRGLVARIGLDLSVTNDSLHAAWPAVDSAIRYRIRVFTAAGELIHEAEESLPRFEWNLPSGQPRTEWYMQVAAVDQVGAVVAESDLHRVDDAR